MNNVNVSEAVYTHSALKSGEAKTHTLHRFWANIHDTQATNLCLPNIIKPFKHTRDTLELVPKRDSLLRRHAL